MSSIVDERGFNQGFRLGLAQRTRLRRRAAAIAQEMGTHPERPARILELGCGTGELAAELTGLTNGEVTGVDISPSFISEASRRHPHARLSFRVADLSLTSEANEKQNYDYIVGNGILHHLYDHLDEFLPKLKDWLVSGGKLIFWEPNLFNPYVLAIFTIPILRRLARLEPGEMAFTPQFIAGKLAHAGFCEIHAVPRDFLIPPTPTFLIDAVVSASDRLDHWWLVRFAAQSVFLTAVKS